MLPVTIDLPTDREAIQIQAALPSDHEVSNGEIWIPTRDEFELSMAKSLVDNKIEEIRSIYDELGWSNEGVIGLAEALLFESIKKEIFNLQISRSLDNRIMIFKEEANQVFRNVLIDEDGDLSFILVPSDRTKATSEFYDLDEGIDLRKLITRLI